MMTPKHIVSGEVVVLNNKNKVLLIKDPERGWEIPGGQVEKGESIRQGTIREVKEETGMEIELIRFCGVYQNLKRDICNHIFLGKAIGGQLTTSSESLEVGFFSVDQALEMILRSYIRERIINSLNTAEQPFLVEFSD